MSSLCRLVPGSRASLKLGPLLSVHVMMMLNSHALKLTPAFIMSSAVLFLILISTASFVHAQTGEAVVAVVNNRQITQQEVDASVLAELLPLEQQIHAIRKAALENCIGRILLEEEAKRRGVSVEDLKKQLTAGKVEIPESQVEQAYLENAPAFAQMSPDEAKERIRLDLETQARMRNYRAALLKLKESARVEIRLPEPLLPSFHLNDNAPAIGAPQARLTVVEFSDFQCPYCKEMQGTIRRVMQSYGSYVKVVFRHLPLEIHPQAFPAAQAAVCAAEQRRFWQYHDALFASEDLSPTTLNKIAANLNLDLTKFGHCLDSESSRMVVLEDMREAKQLGIKGTPAFLIDGKLFQGVLSFEEIKTIIEQELQSAQPHPPSLNGRKN